MGGVQGDGGLHHVVRNGCFGKPRPRPHRAIGKDQRDFIVLGVKAGSRLADVISDHEITAFSMQFIEGMSQHIFGLGGESDEYAAVAAFRSQ